MWGGEGVCANERFTVRSATVTRSTNPPFQNVLGCLHNIWVQARALHASSPLVVTCQLDGRQILLVTCHCHRTRASEMCKQPRQGSGTGFVGSKRRWTSAVGNSIKCKRFKQNIWQGCETFYVRLRRKEPITTLRNKSYSCWCHISIETSRPLCWTRLLDIFTFEVRSSQKDLM
jgi:hypothetical protein